MSHNTERGVTYFHRYTILFRSSQELAMLVYFTKSTDSLSHQVPSLQTSVTTQFSRNCFVIIPITELVFIVRRYKLVLGHVPSTEQPHTPHPKILFVGTLVSQKMGRVYRPLNSCIGVYWKYADIENVMDKTGSVLQFCRNLGVPHKT